MRPLVATLAFCFVAACPAPPVPNQLDPLSLTVSIADDAPAADPTLAPDVTGKLPSGVASDVKVFDLGNVGIAGGESGDIFVDVKSGLGAFTVLVYGQPENTVIVSKVVDPSGNLVVSDIDQDPPLADFFQKFAKGFPAQAFSVNRVLGSLGSGSFLVPNTPAVAAASGRWKVRVGNFSVDLNSVPARRTPVDKPVHVVILAKGQDTGAGKLDVNLHFTGGSGITAAEAPNDALIQGALAEMKKAYATANIAIGDVRYDDVDESFQHVNLAQNQCDGGDLDKVVAAGDGDPGVDLFFVEGFTCIVGQSGTDIGQSIGGIAAGLPGPPFVRGTTHAGVAVSTSFSSGEPQPLGVVMAHETGHFLGLYHTRESGAGVNVIFDEIDDTPNDSGAVENLMYFANQDNTSVTENQAHVLRTNPFVTYVTQ